LQLLSRFAIATAAPAFLAAIGLGFSTNETVHRTPMFSDDATFDFNSGCMPTPGALAPLGLVEIEHRHRGKTGATLVTSTRAWRFG
jgi:hypothetical protein